MIKNGSIRRITVATLSLFLIILSIHFFPQDEIKIPSKTTYVDVFESPVYIKDKNDYVARTNIIVTNKSDKISLANELIESITYRSNKSIYLPSNFNACISENAIVDNIEIEDDLIKINFLNSIFDNTLCSEEQTIESIVFTLTEIDGINKVRIYIDHILLDKLPFSKKVLPNILSRDIGINKQSNFNTIKNTQSVITYFTNKSDDETYYVPVTFITNSNDEKIEIIIKNLESKETLDSNLSSYIKAGIILKDYEILEDKFILEFNNVIFNNFDKIDEEVMYGLALSIYDNYNIKNIEFSVDSKKISTYTLKTS